MRDKLAKKRQSVRLSSLAARSRDSLYAPVSARTFVCLTNIPTPYRLFQFGLMRRELSDRGWSFEAWFMAASEPRRSWKFSDSQFDFPHRFLRGLHFKLGSDSLYFNGELLGLLRGIRPDVLLIAGGWIHPSVWMACMSSAPQRTIFWSESHLASMRRTKMAVRLARKFVLSRFREFAVPGELAKKYVERHAGSHRIYLLANIVDPSIFRDEVRKLCRATRIDNESSRDRRVLLISARLAPEKGLAAFFDGLQLLNEDEKRRLSLWVAGSGPQFPELQRWIGSHDLDIRLLGHRSESEMVKLYAEADGFCLPSVSDPNPLSVIEALWAGLPLLLSSRVGNHIECLKDSENGFLFDPADPRSIAGAVSRWLSLSAPELAQFGEGSHEIAQKGFEPNKVIHEFLDRVLLEDCAEPKQAAGAVGAFG
jgi:glycosyltransferase involved in cell wall biosynthesis